MRKGQLCGILTQKKMITIEEINEIGRCFWKSRILLTAVELNLFDVFHKPLTAEAISTRLNLDRRAIEILLNALTAMGILKKKRKLFTPVEWASKYLRTDSEEYPGGGLRHMLRLWESWTQLTTVVKTGRPASLERNSSWEKDFILAMEHFAKGTAKKVAELIDLSQAEKMLDLGGGPGAYTTAFLEKNPQLKAVVFDRPGPIEIARKLLQEKGLLDLRRITFMAGDFFEDKIGQDYDFVWVSSIIHSLGEEEIKWLLKQVYQSLKPKGRIAVRDFLLDETKTYPSWAALFAVNMLVNTQKGRSYTLKEVMGWLEQIGYKSITTTPLDQRSTMVLGEKPL